MSESKVYTYRKQHADHLIKQATEAFANHTIACTLERQWHIRNPGHSSYATSIAAMSHGLLAVAGDIDTVVFGHCHHADPRKMVAWIGGTTDAGYYVAQKARIGMGLPLLERDEGLAKLEINEYRHENSDDLSPREPEALIDALSLVDDSIEQAEAHIVTEFDCDTIEALLPLGSVLPGRIVYAWVAVHRLYKILEGADE